MPLVLEAPARRGRRTGWIRSASAAAVLAVSSAIGSAACSPTFNWRDAPVGDGGLIALLPCKPDRATRDMPIGTGSSAVTVDMAGCEAGGATFAVAHTSAADVAQATAWLDAWQRAMRAQLSTAGATETAPHVAHAAGTPAPMRIDTASAGPEAQGPNTHVLWFAQLRGGKISLYQATVLGRPASGDAVATFFDGLRLP